MRRALRRHGVRSWRCVALAVLLVMDPAASQDIFKWVDENGIVNYGEAVPEGVEVFERIVIAPSAAPAALPASSQPTLTVLTPAVPPERAAPANGIEVDPAPVAAEAAASQSLSDSTPEALERACEAARERELAPLRDAAIAECKAAPRANPAFCERFYADFGDGGLTRDGAQRPRMFDDLPECVAAREARAGRRSSRAPRQ